MSAVPSLNESFTTTQGQFCWLGFGQRFSMRTLSLVSRSLGSVWGLLVCKCIILAVSTLDIYLTVKYVEYLPQLELNPVGRWLLELDHGPKYKLQYAAAFITAKFFGNVVVLAILEMLGHCRFRRVGVVAAAVAVIQITLGAFLLYADLEYTKF